MGMNLLVEMELNCAIKREFLEFNQISPVCPGGKALSKFPGFYLMPPLKGKGSVWSRLGIFKVLKGEMEVKFPFLQRCWILEFCDFVGGDFGGVSGSLNQTLLDPEYSRQEQPEGLGWGSTPWTHPKNPV